MRVYACIYILKIIAGMKLGSSMCHYCCLVADKVKLTINSKTEFATFLDNRVTGTITLYLKCQSHVLETRLRKVQANCV